MRWKATRTVLLPVVLALLVAAALPVVAGGSTAKAEDTAKVVVKVMYMTDSGKKPLVGVPVHLVYPEGFEVVKCTNARGKAVFNDVPAGDGYMLYSGPTLAKPAKKCTNWRFKNPDTRKPLFTVAWAAGGNTHGIRAADTFAIGTADRAKNRDTQRWVIRALARGRNVCFGLRATIIGDAWDNTLNGTPRDDVIKGLGGDDILSGKGGDDIICGGTGRDRLFGDGGHDLLFGERDGDDLDGGPDMDVLDGGPSVDRCVNDPLDWLINCGEDR